MFTTDILHTTPMLKKLLFPIIFLLVCNVGHSQESGYYQKKADSILRKLPSVKTDSLKMDAYVKLAKVALLTKKPDDTDKYTRHALNASKRIKLYSGKGGHYLVFAEIQRLYDEQKERQYLLLAYNEAKKAGNWQVLAYAGRMLGVNYQSTDFKAAIKYFKESADVYKVHNKYDDYCKSALLLAQLYVDKFKLNEVVDLSNAVLNVAQKYRLDEHVVHTSALLVQVYGILGNEEKTVQYSLDILKKTESGKFPIINRCSFFSYLADYYKSKKNNKKAREFTEKLKDCKNINYTPSDAILFRASAFIKEGDTVRASAEYDKAAKIAVEEKRYAALIQIGNVYFTGKDYTKASTYYKQALSIANERNIAKPIAECEAYVGVNCVMLFKNYKDRAILNEGITLLEKSVAFYKIAQDYGMAGSVAYQLSEAYELVGKHKQALSAHKDYAVYKDSAWDRSNREALITKQAQYEYSKKEAILKTNQKAALAQEQTNRNYAYAGIGVFVLISVGAGVAYSRKRKDNRIIAAEKKRSDELLLNILPAEVAEELKAKGEAGAKNYDHVSILFTDFVGFTKLSEKFSPEELLGELNYCFKAFDEIITKHNIEKIKTIGDSYMAVSGLPSGNTDHAINAVNAAIEMRNFIENYKAERKAQGRVYFEMRTGINSGEVVAGIVGIKKFAYDVWGDAVNIASRMESNGVAGKINISQTTYELIKSDFETEYRGELEAKGKGHIKMYFVEPKTNGWI
jgi:adenylate cyclase